MKPSDFRDELKKIMPGYKWTVKKNHFETSVKMVAEGIQSSGFNRLSTLQVTRSDVEGKVLYEVKSAGFGKRSPWLHTTEDRTLARALRSLQDHYETMARHYSTHACDLQKGRRAEGEEQK